MTPLNKIARPEAISHFLWNKFSEITRLSQKITACLEIPKSKKTQNKMNLSDLERFRSGKSKNYSKFIILASPRTGSTWLCHHLRNHPNMVCFAEIFNPNGCYILRPFDFKDEDLKTRNADPVAFLEKYIYHSYENKVRSVGFKIFYLSHGIDGNKPLLKWLLNCSDLKVIHLFRKNLLKTYVSHQIASRIGKWARIISSETIHVNINECIRYFNRILMQQKTFSRIFQNKECLNIFYENMLEKPQLVIGEVQEFLNVKPKALKSDFLRQERRPLSEIIINYEEIKKGLSNTKWESFLEP